jgi:hypothetical protein
MQQSVQSSPDMLVNKAIIVILPCKDKATMGAIKMTPTQNWMS